MEARRKLPIQKVLGSNNPVELMTKNVDAGKINQYLTFIDIHFRGGRAGVASQLHSLDADYDTWDSRGNRGRWIRRHRVWRTSLVTPFRICKGPGRHVVLDSCRVTRGVDVNGKAFEVVDNWTDPNRAHLDLGFRWIGRTAFVVKGAARDLVNQDKVDDDVMNKAANLRKLNGVVDKECRMRGDVWRSLRESTDEVAWAAM